MFFGIATCGQGKRRGDERYTASGQHGPSFFHADRTIATAQRALLSIPSSLPSLCCCPVFHACVSLLNELLEELGCGTSVDAVHQVEELLDAVLCKTQK